MALARKGEVMTQVRTYQRGRLEDRIVHIRKRIAKHDHIVGQLGYTPDISTDHDVLEGPLLQELQDEIAQLEAEIVDGIPQ